MKRTSTANWKGTGKDGKGTLSSASTVLKQYAIFIQLTVCRGGWYQS